MTERVEAVVIGAGVVGLACARALALAGREVVVLEAAAAIGSGITARNSQVIHAGIYYPPGSLKARACVAGAAALYAYCAAHGVAVLRLGKLIVARGAPQVAALAGLRAQAAANGVALDLLDAAAVRAREPEVVCDAALWSPGTGIVDGPGLVRALLGDIEDAGGMLALNAPVEAVGPGLVVRVGGAAPMDLAARLVVNAAGLDAVGLAARIAGLGPPPAQALAKGSYFALTGRAPFRHLIYPVPEPGGLGIHATLDLGGQVRFGPDVEWVAARDDAVDPARAARFAAAIRTWWPALPDDALVPAYCGIRPKLAGPGAPAADFRIDGPGEHGVAGLVCLYGIESPGLTSALALADEVVIRLGVAARAAAPI